MSVRTTAVKREVARLFALTTTLMLCFTVPLHKTRRNTNAPHFCKLSIRPFFFIAAGAYLQGVYRFTVYVPSPSFSIIRFV
jgi:hypothetical protein